MVLLIGVLAVAGRGQSQQNALMTFGSTIKSDFAALFKRVWDFTLCPTAEGRKQVTGAIASSSDVNSNGLYTAIIGLIKTTDHRL